MIDVDHVSMYYGSKKALNSISFHVNQGEIFGILGANGAGKSTLIEIMLGLKKNKEGSVSIFGHNMAVRDQKMFEHIGVQLQQSSYQNKITVEELCKERAVLYGENVSYEEILKDFELADKKKQKVETLSGGERQKLSVLLAIMHHPDLVMLDELTTGLDVVARREIWKYLLQLKKSGISIVLTSHYMDEVERLCNRVLIIKSGNEIVQGTVDEVIKATPYQTMEQAYLWYMGEEELL